MPENKLPNQGINNNNSVPKKPKDKSVDEFKLHQIRTYESDLKSLTPAKIRQEQLRMQKEAALRKQEEDKRVWEKRDFERKSKKKEQSEKNKENDEKNIIRSQKEKEKDEKKRIKEEKKRKEKELRELEKRKAVELKEQLKSAKENEKEEAKIEEERKKREKEREKEKEEEKKKEPEPVVKEVPKPPPPKPEVEIAPEPETEPEPVVEQQEKEQFPIAKFLNIEEDQKPTAEQPAQDINSTQEYLQNFERPNVKLSQENFTQPNKYSGINRLALIIFIVLILLGLGIWAAISFWPDKGEGPTTTSTELNSFLAVDSEAVIYINDKTSEELFAGIRGEMGKVIDKNSINKIIIADKTSDVQENTESVEEISTEIGTAVFFELINANAPLPFVRALNDKYILGYVGTGKTNSRFILFEVKDFDNAYAGMLSWEDLSVSPLTNIFPQLNVAYRSNTIAARSNGYFRDQVIKKEDARITVNEEGKILMFYSFIDNNKYLLFTDNALAKEEIEKRLRN